LAVPASAQYRTIEGTIGSADGSTPPLGLSIGGYRATCANVGAFSLQLGANIDLLNPDGGRGCYYHTLTGPGPVPFQMLVNEAWTRDLGAMRIGGSSLTAVPYYHPPSGTFGSASTPFYFDVRDAGTVQCPPGSCFGTVDVRLFSRFGSVRGRVRHRTGQPVGAGFVVAAYAANNTGTLWKQTTTDENGYYDFTETDASPLLNTNPIFRTDVAYLSGTVLARENNWGLAVCGDSGFGLCPANKTTVGRGDPRLHLGGGGGTASGIFAER
jgi:hypothetical protein